MAGLHISKAQRQQVFEMFGGRCAYCGRDLPARWHVDHVEPVMRIPLTGHREDGFRVENGDRHRLDNFMPACPPCNIDKHAMTPERWKGWLKVRLEALRKTPGFRLLEAHGLVTATGSEIRFLYEDVAASEDEPPA